MENDLKFLLGRLRSSKTAEQCTSSSGAYTSGAEQSMQSYIQKRPSCVGATQALVSYQTVKKPGVMGSACHHFQGACPGDHYISRPVSSLSAESSLRSSLSGAGLACHYAMISTKGLSD